MSISTKKGDTGETSLWSGQRISKAHIRVESYGTIDELNSFIADARHAAKQEKIIQRLCKIQHELFQVAGTLACVGKTYINPITEQEVDELTESVHEIEALIELTGFVIPGNTVQSAKIDICRTIARRAERIIARLNQLEPVDPCIIRYMNRLSDYLYMAARFEEHCEGKLEIRKKRKKHHET